MKNRGKYWMYKCVGLVWAVGAAREGVAMEAATPSSRWLQVAHLIHHTPLLIKASSNEVYLSTAFAERRICSGNFHRSCLPRLPVNVNAAFNPWTALNAQVQPADCWNLVFVDYPRQNYGVIELCNWSTLSISSVCDILARTFSSNFWNLTQVNIRYNFEFFDSKCLHYIKIGFTCVLSQYLGFLQLWANKNL